MAKNRYIVIFLIALVILIAPFQTGAAHFLLKFDSKQTSSDSADKNYIIVSEYAENIQNSGYFTDYEDISGGFRTNKINKTKNYIKNLNTFNNNINFENNTDNATENEYDSDKTVDSLQNGGYEITVSENENAENSGSVNSDKTNTAKGKEYYNGFGVVSQSTYQISQTRTSIDFVYGGKTFRYVDEIINPTDHLVAETIYDRRINSSPEEKIRFVERCVNAGATHQKAVEYCFPLLPKTINSLKKYIDAAPIESTITFNPDKKPMFTITKEKNGYELLLDKLYRDIFYALKRSSGAVINIVPKTLYPTVTAHDNVMATKLRASFITKYPNSTEERRHNIKLAFSKLNGKTLKPNDEFSFNKTVGRRTEKNGFKSAKIIFKGEYVDGVGGGVCQVSTALYNCAIRADLNITQVRSHSLASSYVPASFDAMVNSDSSDLRFKNNSKMPVFIRTKVKDDEATVEIYGTQLPYKISIESVIVSNNEPPPDKTIIDYEYKYVAADAEPGSQLRVNYSHGAIKSEGYLLYYSMSGKLIEKRLIRKDSYNSCAGTIAIAPPRENKQMKNEQDKANNR